MKRFLQVILGLILLLVGIVGVLYAAGINLPWGPPESTSSGYLSPISGGTKDLTIAGGGCVNIDSTTNTQYFIPTRTAGEVASFTGHLPSGLSVGSCATSCSWNMGGGPAYCGNRTGIPLWQGEEFDTIVTPTCTLALSGVVKAVTEGESCPGGTTIYPVICECGGSPITGSCGTANGGIFTSYPSSNHCAAGIKVNVDIVGADNVYNWRCDGVRDGSDVNCSAMKSGGAPSCAGSFSSNFGYTIFDFELSVGQSIGPRLVPPIPAGKFGSYCSGDGGATCIDTDVRSDHVTYLCSLAVNGSCGSANGTSTATYPASNHCSAGTKTDVDTTATDGIYNWRCDGTGGGSNVNCNATKSSGLECIMHGRNPEALSTDYCPGYPTNDPGYHGRNASGDSVLWSVGPSQPNCAGLPVVHKTQAQIDAMPLCISCMTDCGILGDGEACDEGEGAAFGSCNALYDPSDQGKILSYCSPGTRILTQCADACSTEVGRSYWNRGNSFLPDYHCPLGITIKRP